MRPQRPFQFHLEIHEASIAPTREWTPPLPGWIFAQLAAGSGYWLNARQAQELPAGSVLLLAPRSKGCLRASQIGRIVVRFFSFESAHLAGLMSLAEQEFFARAGADDFAARILPPGESVAGRFQKLCEEEKEPGLALRIALVQLFVEVIGDELRRLKAKGPAGSDAKERLADLLREIPAAALLDLAFSDLVQKARCTPRHLSRVFRETLGMSFREKQTEIRLARARELLATTGYKVVDVALESGYQSLSLFNYMFKRRFGVSPARWREQVKTRRTSSKGPARRATLKLLPAALTRTMNPMPFPTANPA